MFGQFSQKKNQGTPTSEESFNIKGFLSKPQERRVCCKTWLYEQSEAWDFVYPQIREVALTPASEGDLQLFQSGRQSHETKLSWSVGKKVPQQSWSVPKMCPPGTGYRWPSHTSSVPLTQNTHSLISPIPILSQWKSVRTVFRIFPETKDW